MVCPQKFASKGIVVGNENLNVRDLYREHNDMGFGHMDDASESW